MFFLSTEVKEFIGYISIIVTLASYAIYMLSIARGHTKPHAFSWLVWGLVTAIIFLAQYIKGAGAGSWSTAVSALCLLSIGIAAIWYGEKECTKGDWVSFISTLSAIPIWVLSNDPLLSVVLLTLIDVYAYYPTIRKSFYKPNQELILKYSLTNIKLILSICAMEKYSLVSLIYPVVSIMMEFFVIGVLLRGRYFVKLSKERGYNNKMKLKYCSITGADDDVDVSDLSEIATEYSFVEWAILLLPARAATPRFPSYDWIKKFSKEYEGIHTAMHLCEEGLIDFIEGRKEVLDLMQGFKRIQLNLKYGDVNGRYDPEVLLKRVEESSEWDFIIQYSKDKKTLLPLLKDIPNHAVLFDDSAGEGISPEKWDPPLGGHFCGYAGGINPENVKENLEMISRVVPEDYITWIDMETGVRTDNVFDLNKVRRVLEVSNDYVG